MKTPKPNGDQLIRLGRTKCMIEAPYVATALAQMPLVITETVPTAAVSKDGVIYFNPKFAEQIANSSEHVKQAAARVGFVLYHEVMHFIRAHHQRAPQPMDERVQKRWNLATDCEVNDHVPARLEMPCYEDGTPMGIRPEKYKLPIGELAEWYYEHLPEGAEQQIGDEYFQIGGSAGDGVPREWEKGDQRGLSSSEQELIRESVAKSILEHHKSAGDMPASLVRWAKLELEKRIDWRKRLRHIIGRRIADAQIARSNYSFRKPNRRYTNTTNVIVPSLRQSTAPNIAVVIDTSGSVGQEELNFAVGETLNIIQTFQTEIVVIPCDAQAYEATKVRTKRDFRVDTLKGGGGTNMVAGIESAKAHRPDAIIVITDGYTPYPTTADKQVVWCIYGHDISALPTPPTPPWREEQIIRVRLNR